MNLMDILPLVMLSSLDPTKAGDGGKADELKMLHDMLMKMDDPGLAEQAALVAHAIADLRRS